MVLELGFWQFRPANLKLPNFKVAERHTFDLVYTALVQQRLGAVLQGIILFPAFTYPLCSRRYYIAHCGTTTKQNVIIIRCDIYIYIDVVLSFGKGAPRFFMPIACHTTQLELY